MKRIKPLLILAFASIGVCGLLYGGWRFYQRKVAQAQARALFSAPPPSPIPDIFHQKPGPPPPQ